MWSAVLGIFANIRHLVKQRLHSPKYGAPPRKTHPHRSPEWSDLNQILLCILQKIPSNTHTSEPQRKGLSHLNFSYTSAPHKHNPYSSPPQPIIHATRQGRGIIGRSRTRDSVTARHHPEQENSEQEFFCERRVGRTCRRRADNISQGAPELRGRCPPVSVPVPRTPGPPQLRTQDIFTYYVHFLLNLSLPGCLWK